MHVKWKIFDWYVKNLEVLFVITLFQLLLWSYLHFLKWLFGFTFLRMALMTEVPIETSLLICRVNQWTGFCMIGTSITKELDLSKR